MNAMFEEHVLRQPQEKNTSHYNQVQYMIDRPWQYVAMDFKGPVGNQFYFLLIIDEYSHFPVVEIVTTAAADKVIPLLDKVFSTHGIPETVKSDNGPPLNGEDMRIYAQQ